MIVSAALFGAVFSFGYTQALEHGFEDLATFYEPDAVQRIDLEVSEANLTQMKAALPERVYVPAHFQWKNTVIKNVGIRYKGNSSSHPRQPHKRSFLIRFSKYRKDQRFLGLERVALDNGVQFGSLFSERLITDILRDVGVTASRCNYATLWLNGQYLGVYVNVERIDRTFLDRHFDDAAGPLFKVHEGGPGADLRFVSDHPSVYQNAFDLKSDDFQRPYDQLLAFIRGINQPSTASGDIEFGESFDVESFLKTMAVMLFSGAFDQYTGWGPHNYYLYRNPTDQRWHYITWDLDVGFADRAFGRVPVLEGWHAAWPVPVPGRPLLERIVSDEKLLGDYRKVAASILERYFHPEILIPKLRRIYSLIESPLKTDPFPHRRVTVDESPGYDNIVRTIESFIQRRYLLAKEQLKRPGPRPRPANGAAHAPGGGPRPGPPSANAPSDLRVVRAGRSVELEWTDNAEGERAFIVQKCMGPDCDDFRNAVGQPGENITTAEDLHVEPGVTYRYRVYALFPTATGPKGTGPSNVVSVTIPTVKPRQGP